VLVNVPNSSELAQEEAFGPVVMIDSFSSFEEVIARINQSKFGLQIGVFCHDINRVWKLFEEAEVGGVIHNDVPSWRVDHMPYG